VSGMTGPTENVPVLWAIPWVNIIPTETVPFMRPWSLWRRILKKAWFLWTATETSDQLRETAPRLCVIQRQDLQNSPRRSVLPIWIKMLLISDPILMRQKRNLSFSRYVCRIFLSTARRELP